MVVSTAAAAGILYCFGLGAVQVGGALIAGACTGGRRALRGDLEGAGKAFLGGVLAPIYVTSEIVGEAGRNGFGFVSDCYSKCRGRDLPDLRIDEVAESIQTMVQHRVNMIASRFERQLEQVMSQVPAVPAPASSSAVTVAAAATAAAARRRQQTSVLPPAPAPAEAMATS